MTLHEISAETGVPLAPLRGRINRGWSAERAVSTPPFPRGQAATRHGPFDNAFAGTGVSVVILVAERSGGPT